MHRILLLSLLIILNFISCERPTEINIDDDGIPPAVPSGLVIYDAADGVIIIEWKRNSEPDLKGFNIYRKINSGDYNFIAFTTDDYYIDDSLDYFFDYSYKISALDIWDKESETTFEVTAKPSNKTVPRKPSGTIVNGRNWLGEISVSLNWFPNDEADLAGYNIYRGNNSGFSADSISLLAFSETPFYNDTNDLSLYVTYYYKIRAIDKGGLLSNESEASSDNVLEIPEMISPVDNYQSAFFNNFKIKAVDIPASYTIVVQENLFFSEVWRSDFYSSVTGDTISVPFTFRNFLLNKKYYWRVITYSESREPNSVSEFRSFIITE